jgi:hypothetical protein
MLARISHAVMRNLGMPHNDRYDNRKLKIQQEINLFGK